MIHIQKGNPPKKFQEFKQQNPQAHFDDMPSDIKVALRQSLLEEQGYLKANRESALKALKDKLLQKCKDKSANLLLIEKWLKFYRDKNESGERAEYYGILIDYLLKRQKKWSSAIS